MIVNRELTLPGGARLVPESAGDDSHLINAETKHMYLTFPGLTHRLKKKVVRPDMILAKTRNGHIQLSSFRKNAIFLFFNNIARYKITLQTKEARLYPEMDVDLDRMSILPTFPVTDSFGRMDTCYLEKISATTLVYSFTELTDSGFTEETELFTWETEANLDHGKESMRKCDINEAVKADEDDMFTIIMERSFIADLNKVEFRARLYWAKHSLFIHLPDTFAKLERKRVQVKCTFVNGGILMEEMDLVTSMMDSSLRSTQALYTPTVVRGLQDVQAQLLLSTREEVQKRLRDIIHAADIIIREKTSAATIITQDIVNRLFREIDMYMYDISKQLTRSGNITSPAAASMMNHLKDEVRKYKLNAIRMLTQAGYTGESDVIDQLEILEFTEVPNDVYMGNDKL